jgi:hypothetical protein
MSNYNYFNKNILGSLDKYFVPMAHVISSSNTQYGGAGNGLTPANHNRALLPLPLLSTYHVPITSIVTPGGTPPSGTPPSGTPPSDSPPSDSPPSDSPPSDSPPSDSPPSGTSGTPPPTPPNSTLVTRISNTGYPIRYDSINDATPVIHSDTEEYLNQTFKQKEERRTYEAEQNQRRIKDAVSYGPRNKLSAVFGNNLFQGTNNGVAVAVAMNPAKKSAAAPTVVTSAALSDNSDNPMDFELFRNTTQKTEQTEQTKQITGPQLMKQLEQSRSDMSNQLPEWMQTSRLNKYMINNIA